jgi:hypothetical protein
MDDSLLNFHSVFFRDMAIGIFGLKLATTFNNYAFDNDKSPVSFINNL